MSSRISISLLIVVDHESSYSANETRRCDFYLGTPSTHKLETKTKSTKAKATTTTKEASAKRKQSSCGGPIRLVMLGILGTLALTLMLGTIGYSFTCFITSSKRMMYPCKCWRLLAAVVASESESACPPFPRSLVRTLLAYYFYAIIIQGSPRHVYQDAVAYLGNHDHCSTRPRNLCSYGTGDIDDLWLRDSAAQVHTLLVPVFPNGTSLVQQDAQLDRIVSGGLD
jgi:hypothetical protein